MKNILTLIFLALISANGFTQKVKIKDDIAFVDGEEYLNWKKRSGGNEISVSGISSTEVEISVMYLSYVDPNKISNSNPEGKVRYIEINFLTLDKKCEISSRGHKGIVSLLYEDKIYLDGILNEENVDKFVKRYGTKYTDNRPGGNVTIIINE